MTRKKLHLTKLEDDPIWKEACALAEYMYAHLHTLPEEEKWETQHKLRGSANDMMYYTSQAIGLGWLQGATYEWSQVRKFANALKAMCRFAGRQGMLELEPDIMVRLDAFIKQVDQKFSAALKETEATNKEEMEDWRKQYVMWQQMGTKA
jgi:hypothetical protein